MIYNKTPNEALEKCGFISIAGKFALSEMDKLVESISEIYEGTDTSDIKVGERKIILTKDLNKMKKYGNFYYEINGYYVNGESPLVDVYIYQKAERICNDETYQWKQKEYSRTFTMIRDQLEFQCVYKEKEDCLYIKVYSLKGINRLKETGRRKLIDRIEIDHPVNEDIETAIREWGLQFISELRKAI